MNLLVALYRWSCASLLFCLTLGWGSYTLAAIDVHEFSSETERERYQSFIDDLRCPKCQNQNLSGSDSLIAKDLRNELYVQIKEGRSDQQIVDFMVERYGEFILYKPRLTPATLALWSLPIIILLLGAVILAWIVRRRRLAGNTAETSPLSTEEQARLDALLNDTTKR